MLCIINLSGTDVARSLIESPALLNYDDDTDAVWKGRVAVRIGPDSSSEPQSSDVGFLHACKARPL